MEQGSSKKILFLQIVLMAVFLSVGKCHGIMNQDDVLGSFLPDKFVNKSSNGVDTSDFRNSLESTTIVDDNLTATGPFDSNKIKSPDVGLKEKDWIVKLPGQLPVKFEQYGGYVTVDASKGRAFFYYFVEAKNSKKDSLPLLLWLNGGPGCSSLGQGAMQGQGPFRVHSDGKTLYNNKFSWNKAANVLFLESPVGVGFSYSNTSSDYKKNGDKQAAADNYAFLVNWFKRFPEYRSRDFYITGDGYAGHYAPELAYQILVLNEKATTEDQFINLKGIMIGNAMINENTDLVGIVDFLVNHALIPEEAAVVLKKHCGPSADEPQCKATAHQIKLDIQDINLHNIYAPLCHNSSLTSKPNGASVMKYDPCASFYVKAYLNRAQVQKALHANVTKLKYDWQPCIRAMVPFRWAHSPTSIIPILQDLMASGLRVWVFSGDTDGMVPVTATLSSINEMNLTVQTEWRPWYHAGEVGGYTQVYKGELTFATVRGAGHMVPSFQPGRALSLVTHFLSGMPLPSTKYY